MMIEFRLSPEIDTFCQRERSLSTLLFVANSSVRECIREPFYAMKREILEKHALRAFTANCSIGTKRTPRNAPSLWRSFSDLERTTTRCTIELSMRSTGGSCAELLLRLA